MEALDNGINPANTVYPEDLKPSYLDLSLDGTGNSNGGMSTFGPVIVALMCTALIVLVAAAVVATVVYWCKKSKTTVRRYEQLQEEKDIDVGECKLT